MSVEKFSEQQWQLTAYVLGELKAEVAKRIELAAANDPAMAAEIKSIRDTVAQVTLLYQHESADIQPTQLADLQATAQEFAPSELAATGQVAEPEELVQPIAIGSRSNRLAWIGLLALSASLLVAVYLARPSATSWLLSQKDFNLEDHVDTPAWSMLGTSVSEATAGKSTNSDVVPTDSLKEIGAESELFGDLQIEHIDQLGTVIVRGRAADVERTLAEADSQRMRNDLEASARSLGELAKNAQPTSNPVASAGMDSSAPQPSQLASKAATGPQSSPAKRSEARTKVAQRPAAQNSGMGMGGMGMGARESMMAGGMGGGSGSAKGMVDSPDGLGDPVARGSGMGMMGGMEMGADGGMIAGGMGGIGSADGFAAGPEPGSAKKGQPKRAWESPLATRGLSVASGYGASSSLETMTEDVLPGRSFGTEFGGQAGAGMDSGLLARDARAKGRHWSVESQSTDRYEPIYENQFTQVGEEPLSTFSIDVDTAAYVKARQFLLQSRRLPPANAVRIEEFVNYFEYEYAGPKNNDPFGADLAVTDCPWRPEHKLVRIALQATKVDVKDRPKANIVFLLDVSGSMDEPNKLPLVKESMRMLIEQLGENDRVAMVVYAGAAGCVLESTTGDQQDLILGALGKLNAGGSTNGGQGIQLAYDLARDHFVPGGINRVILCTDGDFNVGVTSTNALVNLVVENAKSKIFLTVLGFGMGNTNDAMMEQISNKGNGVYGFVDSRREAQRQMVKQLAGNLMTVAKDVKIQVEFNPARVAAYRLIGYENRVMAAEDFNNDKKDAGEIGAGHRVTALYEVEPIGAARAKSSRAPVDELRYQKKAVAATPALATDDGASSDELLAVKLRYKQPEGDTSKLLTFPLVDDSKKFRDADRDFKWATTVAEFAMLLRNSQHKGSATWSGLLEQADEAAGVSPDATRQECLDMMRVAAGLSGQH